MSKKLWRAMGLRHPKTTQERRANGKRSKWARGRRSAANLPEAWDDINLSRRGRGWKNKRRTQYICGGRGTKYVLYIPAEDGRRWITYYKTVRLVREFCEQQEISLNIKDDIEVTIYEKTQTHVGMIVDTVPVFREGGDGIKRIWYYRSVWEQIPLEQPVVIKHRYATVKGYELTFWTSKYGGLSYFLRSIGLTAPILGV
jgi:hypothetical protein